MPSLELGLAGTLWDKGHSRLGTQVTDLLRLMRAAALVCSPVQDGVRIVCGFLIGFVLSLGPASIRGQGCSELFRSLRMKGGHSACVASVAQRAHEGRQPYE